MADEVLPMLDMLMKACFTEPANVQHRIGLADHLAEEGLHELEHTHLLTVPFGRWVTLPTRGQFVWAVSRQAIVTHNIPWVPQSNGKNYVGLLVDVGDKNWLHEAGSTRCGMCRRAFGSSRYPRWGGNRRGILEFGNPDEIRDLMTLEGKNMFAYHPSLANIQTLVRPDEIKAWWLCDECYHLDEALYHHGCRDARPARV